MGGCPSGFLQFDELCYSYHAERKNWQDARGVAIDHSATDIWLGANDLDTEGKFVWNHTATLVSDAEFTDWAPGQPDDLKNEDCLEFHVTFSHWNDHFCSTQKAFICQR